MINQRMALGMALPFAGLFPGSGMRVLTGRTWPGWCPAQTHTAERA